jgi:hypothetical protein
MTPIYYLYILAAVLAVTVATLSSSLPDGKFPASELAETPNFLNATTANSTAPVFVCKPLPLIGNGLCDLEKNYDTTARNLGYDPLHLLILALLGVCLLLFANNSSYAGSDKIVSLVKFVVVIAILAAILGFL